MNIYDDYLYVDNSILNSYKTCPRKCYFSYIRNWKKVGVDMKMLFGRCWHKGQDEIWSNAQSEMTDQDLTHLASAAFKEEWDLELEKAENSGARIQVEEPYHPLVAQEMYYEYIKRQRAYIAEHDIIYIEQPFAVPMPKRLRTYWIGRWDKVTLFNSAFRDRPVIYEHKTTGWYKKDGYFRSEWIDAFGTDSQLRGYAFAARLNFPERPIPLVVVDAALVHKLIRKGHKLIPESWGPESIDNWLVSTTSWLSKLRGDIDELRIYRDERHEQHIKGQLGPFPPVGGSSCTQYMKSCPYIDLCRFVVNPESSHPYNSDEVPDRFIVEEWSPFDELHIEKLGLKKGEPENAPS